MIGKYMNEKETDMYKKNGINELRKLKDANLYKERLKMNKSFKGTKHDDEKIMKD